MLSLEKAMIREKKLIGADFIPPHSAHTLRRSPFSEPLVQGMKRKIIFVTLYELIAIGCITVGLTVFTGQAPAHSSVAALMSSAIAISWNFL